MNNTFRLTNIEKSNPPTGEETGRWHRYVIESDFTVIYGYAKGSKTQVTQYAKKYVENLNAKRDPAKPQGPWMRRRPRATATR